MLRDIRAHREKVLRYVEENYRIAEMSVGDLLKNQSAPNFMKRLDETNTVLQQCCSKLANLSDCTTLENVEVKRNISLIFFFIGYLTWLYLDGWRIFYRCER